MKSVSPWSLGGSVFLLLVLVCVWTYDPAPAGPQRFSITFPTGAAGEADPIVVTGRPVEADFLAVRYLDDHTLVFLYDSWGVGGPTSGPIAITPGRRYALEVTLPSLAALVTSAEEPTDRMRIVFDGSVVLEAPVSYYQRLPGNVWFGRNPVGGPICRAVFQGELIPEDHPPSNGGDRLWSWLIWGRRQFCTILLVSVGLGGAWHWLRLGALSIFGWGRSTVCSLWRSHRIFLLTATLCSLAFAAMITHGTFRLIFYESFGGFYDHQALSLLEGRLDVPASCLSGEAFVHQGRSYGYFGPTPALLRVPLVIFGWAFGNVSRGAMLLYYVSALVGAYCVLRDLVRRLRPDRPVPAPWEVILFTLHVGLGSTVFFLGSRAFVYHEAILCGLMFAIWSGWAALRQLENPASRWWVAALVLGLLALHARPSAGLFPLLLLAACALIPALADLRLRRFAALRRPLMITLLAGLGVASFNALSYAKFRTLEGCPLRLNVQYDAARLARIEDRQFHLANIPYGLETYLFRPRVTVRPQFPWLGFGEILPPERHPGAKLDLPDYTLALPVGMAGLFLLAVAGSGRALWRSPAARPVVAALWLAFLPLLLALCAAIATAERYTGDFVPFLVCSAALGLATIEGRRGAAVLLALATVWSSALTAAVTIHYQREVVWGVPPEVTEHYEQFRTRIDRFFRVNP